MKFLLSLLLASLGSPPAHAQVQVLADRERQCVFGGEKHPVAVILYNPGLRPAASDLSASLYQASSATVVPLGVVPWKRLEVLPGQTLLESATLDFPSVKGETRLVIKWVAATNQVVGTTEVIVYPADLLKDLKPLAGEAPLGVLDPENQLKPLLKARAVETEDLQESAMEDFRGKLAILGPFASRAQMKEELPNRIKALAQRGVAVVWIQPPPESRETLKPSFYTVLEGHGAVVVVQADSVARLAQRPEAQLNLVHLARLALHPEPAQLPALTPAHSPH